MLFFILSVSYLCAACSVCALLERKLVPEVDAQMRRTLLGFWRHKTCVVLDGVGFPAGLPSELPSVICLK